MSRDEVLAIQGALEQRGAILGLSSSHSIGRDVVSQATHWKSTKEICSVKQNAEFQRHQRQSQGHLQEYQHDVQRHLTDIQNNALSQQVASGEAVEHFETRVESLSR